MTSNVTAIAVRINSAIKNGGANANMSARRRDSADILRIENSSIFRHCMATSTRNGARIRMIRTPKRPELTAEMLMGEIA